MNNHTKGSVLAITTGFVLTFTLLGFGAMYLSGMQGVQANKQVFATQAFWLAESGVERQLQIWSNTPLTGSLGEGTYTASSPINYADPDDPLVRFSFDATGTVGPVTKKIRVLAGANILHAIQSTRNLAAPGAGGDEPAGLNSHIDGTWKEYDNFTWDKIFAPYLPNDMYDKAVAQGPGHVLINPPNNPQPISGITWVDGDLKWTNCTGSGILIVNGNMEMEGGRFDGIIWVNGKVDKINGNDVVSGAIFINNDSDRKQDIDTTINGTAGIHYDAEAIKLALASAGIDDPTFWHHMRHWHEID